MSLGEVGFISGSLLCGLGSHVAEPLGERTKILGRLNWDLRPKEWARGFSSCVVPLHPGASAPEADVAGIQVLREARREGGRRRRHGHVTCDF